MKTPWDIASEIPSAHGIAADTFAHLCGGPGGYVLSTPKFFLLAREVYADFESLEFCLKAGLYRDETQASIDKLQNPFHRWPSDMCNAWCIGVLAGDVVAAYRALIAIGGEREYLCWQDRKNGYRWRKAASPELLTHLQNGQRRRQQRCNRVAEREPR